MLVCRLPHRCSSLLSKAQRAYPKFSTITGKDGMNSFRKSEVLNYGHKYIYNVAADVQKSISYLFWLTDSINIKNTTLVDENTAFIEGVLRIQYPMSRTTYPCLISCHRNKMIEMRAESEDRFIRKFRITWRFDEHPPGPPILKDGVSSSEVVTERTKVTIDCEYSSQWRILGRMIPVLPSELLRWREEEFAEVSMNQLRELCKSGGT